MSRTLIQTCVSHDRGRFMVCIKLCMNIKIILVVAYSAYNSHKLHSYIYIYIYIHIFVSTSPTIAVEDAALFLRIREIPDSDLGLETGYPDWGFTWFSSVPPRKSWVITSNYGMVSSFHMISSHYSLTTYPPPWSWALLEKPSVAQLLKNFPNFMDPEGSLPCSQEPFTGHYPEPDQFSSYHPIRSL
jgi:hypothetical protein